MRQREGPPAKSAVVRDHPDIGGCGVEVDSPLHVAKLPDVELEPPDLAPAEEDVGRSLDQPLALDDPSPFALRAALEAAMRLEHGRLGLLDLEEERVVVRAAMHEDDPARSADAADADHLPRDVDDLVLLEEPPPVQVQRRKVGPKKKLEPLQDGTPIRRARFPHDQGTVLDDAPPVVHDGRHLVEHLEVGVAPGLAEIFLGALAGMRVRRERAENGLLVDARVPELQVPHPGILAQARPVGRDGGADGLLGDRLAPAQESDADPGARHEALDVPFPRALKRFVEVVDAEDQVALCRSEDSEVGHVHVAAGLDVQPGHRRRAQVRRHDRRGPAQERKGRREHPGVAKGHEGGIPGLRLPDQDLDRVGPRPRRRVDPVVASRDALAELFASGHPLLDRGARMEESLDDFCRPPAGTPVAQDRRRLRPRLLRGRLPGRGHWRQPPLESNQATRRFSGRAATAADCTLGQSSHLPRRRGPIGETRSRRADRICGMKPVILVVDDDLASLASLTEALTRRYGADYRIAFHATVRGAREDLERMRDAGESVALIIADQWMQEMQGVELLGRVHKIHPSAQRALLVDWGDRAAAPAILEGCAFGQLENYLRKPWFPPEVHLYPAIGEFLADWTRRHGPRMELVRVIGEELARRTHEVRSFLERSGIPHGYIEAGTDAGKAALETVALDASKLPVVILLDGRTLVDPSNTEISDALGATNLDPRERDCDLAIVGAGPAGLAAAVYGASEGLRTIVVEREAVGGQAGASSLIRNYLGFPRGISGGELAQRAYEQAWLFGTKFVFAREGLRLRADGTSRILTISDGIEIKARVVIIATGAAYRRLDVDGAERFVGAGIFYATPSEVGLLKEQEVFVAGGGNA